MKKISIMLSALILSSMFYTGCTRAADENYLRFAWWGNATRDQRTIEAARLFEQKNPGVTIETEPTAWAGYFDRMNTLAAAGNLPHVMQQDVSYIKQYSDRNQLEDLTSFAQSGLIELIHWEESGLAGGRLNGKLVGLILGTNANGMNIDPEVLQRAGVIIDDTIWTWTDYERIALQVFQRTGVQTMPPADLRQVMEHVARQFGSPMFSLDDRFMGISQNQAAYNAFKDWVELHNRLLAAGVLYDPEDGFIQARAYEEYPIARGRTWNNYNWSNQHIAYQNAAGRPLQYVMLPGVSEQREPFGTYLRASQYISMLATANNKDLAARFIDFFVNDLEANRILLAERGVPIPTHVRADLYSLVDADNKYLFDYITRITPFTSPADPPYPPAAGEVELTLRGGLFEILTGRISLDDGMNQMIQQSNAILQR